MIAPAYKALAKEFARRAAFLKVDVNRNHETSAACGVRSMPTFHFYLNGKLAGQVRRGGDEETKRRRAQREREKRGYGLCLVIVYHGTMYYIILLCAVIAPMYSHPEVYDICVLNATHALPSSAVLIVMSSRKCCYDVMYTLPSPVLGSRREPPSHGHHATSGQGRAPGYLR